MKTSPSFRALACILFVATLLAAEAAGPAWWQSRSLIVPGVSEDDFAAANQGQLKNVAHAAYLEMNEQLQSLGGGGNDLGALFDQLLSSSAAADDYAVVTVGQVRAMALPFYQRLQFLGLITTLPSWLSGASSGEDDYAVANVGQIKNAFNFEITLAILDPDADHDGDGLSNGLELALGLNPYAKDSDGDGIEDGVEDHDQDGIANALDQSNADMSVLSVTIYRPTSGEPL